MREILVETSARHVHVSQETLEILCGAGAQLEVRAPLSQPGQFVSTTRVDVVGYKIDKATGNKVETVMGKGGAWQHPGIFLGDSHYNYVLNNDVTVEKSNGIYLSSYGTKESNFNICRYICSN